MVYFQIDPEFWTLPTSDQATQPSPQGHGESSKRAAEEEESEHLVDKDTSSSEDGISEEDQQMTDLLLSSVPFNPESSQGSLRSSKRLLEGSLEDPILVVKHCKALTILVEKKALKSLETSRAASDLGFTSPTTCNSTSISSSIVSSIFACPTSM